jgi:hypothetical protein
LPNSRYVWPAFLDKVSNGHDAGTINGPMALARGRELGAAAAAKRLLLGPLGFPDIDPLRREFLQSAGKIE